MGTVIAIVVGYIVATEGAKVWFYGHGLKPKRRLRSDALRYAPYMEKHKRDDG